MESLFAQRMNYVPHSFIREILSLALKPGVISFAGGLPNSSLFPVEALQSAMNEVMQESGSDILQYSATEGDIGLRRWIAQRYREKQGLIIPAEQILITNGSQQALDLLAKMLIDKDDNVIIEAPAYLGAIQAFSVYQPQYRPVSINEQGMDIVALKQTLTQYNPKLAYTVSNFQNPSGVSYTEQNKRAVAEAMRGYRALMIDDNPYGELRFSGQATTPFWELLPEQTVMLGSFSKIIAPGLRLGWLVAQDDMMEKLIVLKQAGDLHSSLLPQRAIHRYLEQNSLDEHIHAITDHYGRQRDVMLQAIKQYFPPSAKVTQTDGGMFLWLTLPEKLTAQAVFDLALEENVVFVPGEAFTIHTEKTRDIRLNFSCVEPGNIQKGIKCIGKIIDKLIKA